MKSPILLLSLACLPAYGQVLTSHEVKTIQLQQEAAENLVSRQQQLQQLPKEQQDKVVESLEHLSNTDPNVKAVLDQNGITPKDLLTASPSTLTAPAINLGNLTIFRVIDGNIKPVIIVATGAKPTGTEPVPAMNDAVNKQVEALATTAQSVGRLLYTDKLSFNRGQPNWILAGTVFVSNAGTVATACHVISNMVNLSGSKPVLDDDNIVAVVDFGTSIKPNKLIRVTSVAAVGDLQGLDIAFLKIENSDGIAPLKFAANSQHPEQVFVLGYPELSDLNDQSCSAANLDDTTKYFCQLHKDNPDVIKIGSPGTTHWDQAHFPFDIVTYNAPTRFGQSGSPILDASSLQVIGIHYCCTGLSTGQERLNCATSHVATVTWNEGISGSTIAKSQFLRQFIIESIQAPNAAGGSPSSGQPAISSGMGAHPAFPVAGSEFRISN
jgi:hypothetical protein